MPCPECWRIPYDGAFALGMIGLVVAYGVLAQHWAVSYGRIERHSDWGQMVERVMTAALSPVKR